MKLEKNYAGLELLSFEEASEVNGGESIWYWISYGIGQGVRYVEKTANGVGEFISTTRELNSGLRGVK